MALLLLVGATTGCVNKSQSMLNPKGLQADRIHSLFLVFFWVCAIVFVLVMIFLLMSLMRGRRGGPNDPPDTHPDERREARIWTFVTTCIVITVITLLALMIGDFTTGRKLHQLSSAGNELAIRVIGHQWWWEVQYEDAHPSNIFSTANEIHIPVDPDHPQPVRFDLDSQDVIHSFWVPNLHGKKDLIPGHPTTLWLRADHAGEYYGQCAEFCGYQHAQMRLVVVAEPRHQFEAWVEAQRQTANEPTTDTQKHGKQVFLRNSCVLCHTIIGTTAGGRVGPDLTHIGSRTKLAAGTIPNTYGHMGGWIVDPQRIKPGAKMPQNELTPQDLRALVEYLQSLK